MSIFTRQALRNLMSIEDGPCVSIYAPTHRAGSQTRQDPIRFRNLVDDAERQLIDAGMRSPDVQSLLQPARALQDDHHYWQHQAAGLAVFAAAEHFADFKLPFAPQEVAAVADRFHVPPLLPLVRDDGVFYVLAVSLRRVRLLTGSRDGLAEISPRGLQFGLDEALALDMERQLQMHSHQVRPRTRAGTETGVYHGHEATDAKKYILEYFQKIDHAVREILSGEHAPLVFAGVEYLFPIYQEANSYPKLADTCVTGNFDETDARDLHGPAWDIVGPMFDKEMQAALAELHNSLGTGRAATDLAELLPAAFNGRIHTLFLRPGEPLWGRYDHQGGRLTLEEASSAANDDLLNVLAVQTLRHGGTIFVVENEGVLNESRVGALFRFAAVEPAASVHKHE